MPQSDHLGKVVFFAILTLFPGLRAFADAGCASVNVRTSLHVPPEIGAVRLSDLRVTAWNGLDSEFLLENRVNKEIAHLTVVLEYQTKSGNYSQAVVFEAAPDTKQPSDYLIAAAHVDPLPHSILPGQMKRISGTSPYTPPECPVSARVTMLDIHFGDGSDLRWESSDWWTEPLLASYPTNLSIPDSKSWTSDEYSFIGRVNSEGKMDLVVPLDKVLPSPHDSEVPSGTVAEALKKLTFAPRLCNGKPCVANLILIVKFERSGVATTITDRDAHQRDISKPTVFISLFPRNSDETDWGLEYGNGFGYTTAIAHHEK